MEISKAELASAAAASSPAAQELRGSEILVKALQAENVKYVWGYPGGAVLHIYDAFYKQDTIQHVLVRHEQAAVHAADGYARATGDVGVALVTSGPGVTNAVTGIATAYMDSIPMVIITGQCRPMRSGWTRSRSATRSASPAPSSSTTSWSRT
jgi:acetolactate synthase-1/2/3 large subunit